MARTDERQRETFNRLLDLCAELGTGQALPSEQVLADLLLVSRTVIRAALERLHEAGILQWAGRRKEIVRLPIADDRMTVAEALPTPAQLERQFLEWVLQFDLPPGTALNVTDLARRFRVTPHALQEFLASLSRFGLVKRRARGGWEMLGFTRDYAVELSEFRMVLELHAVQTLLATPATHPVWARLEGLRQAHLDLAAQIDSRFHEFSPLDGAFHAAINGVVRNRFADGFQKVISLIFHYHYQWDKTDERDRNAAAISEHLRLIAALFARDEAAALQAARDHLLQSRQTLLASLRDHRRP